MYLIPIPGNNTIAKAAEICGSQDTNMFFGCNQVLFVTFYVSWAFAVLFILAGIFAQYRYVDRGRCLPTAHFDPSKYISECPYHYGTEAGNGESCQNEALTG
jgi:hypothetical protein